MEYNRLLRLFQEFSEAPMIDFLEMLLSTLDEEQRNKLMIEDISYHRCSAQIVTLEAWICIEPVENNQWIWARIELNGETNTIEESYLTKEGFRENALTSIKDCIEQYEKKG